MGAEGLLLLLGMRSRFLLYISIMVTETAGGSWKSREIDSVNVSVHLKCHPGLWEVSLPLGMSGF